MYIPKLCKHSYINSHIVLHIYSTYEYATHNQCMMRTAQDIGLSHSINFPILAFGTF